MGFLATIIAKIFGSNVLSDIAGQYFDTVKNKANSRNERERIKAKAELDRLVAKSETVKAMAPYRAFWFGWLLFVVPLGVFWGKVVVWDTVLGYGVTNPLYGQIALWAEMIVHAIFPSGAFVGAAAAVSAAIVGRRK